MNEEIALFGTSVHRIYLGLILNHTFNWYQMSHKTLYWCRTVIAKHLKGSPGISHKRNIKEKQALHFP